MKNVRPAARGASWVPPDEMRSAADSAAAGVRRRACRDAPRQGRTGFPNLSLGVMSGMVCLNEANHRSGTPNASTHLVVRKSLASAGQVLETCPTNDGGLAEPGQGHRPVLRRGEPTCDRQSGFPALFLCGSRVSRVIPTVVPVLIGRSALAGSEAGAPCHCPPAGRRESVVRFAQLARPTESCHA